MHDVSAAGWKMAVMSSALPSPVLTFADIVAFSDLVREQCPDNEFAKKTIDHLFAVLVEQNPPAVDDPVRLPAHLDALERRIRKDWRAWVALLPSAPEERRYPDPRSPGGLPASWRVVASTMVVEPGVDADEVFGEPDAPVLVVVARPEEGGWVLLRHERPNVSPVPLHEVDGLSGETTQTWLDESLGHLLTHASEGATEKTALGRRVRPLVPWLREVFMASFDEADPVEAAEKMLYALTGSVGALPQAAH